MKAVVLHQPAGIDRLELVDVEDPGEPGAGEIRVRIRASSLNFHDLGVVTGRLPSSDGRIPMSDGAGVVEAVGEGVDEFRVGDAVVSCFFPQWLDGGPAIADFSTTPGDGVDGYAREVVVRPATWFTLAPHGYSHTEAATLTTAGLAAWRALIVDGGLKAGDSVLVLGTGGVSIFALQIARLMGAEVIATSSSDAKLERARTRISPMQYVKSTRLHQSRLLMAREGMTAASACHAVGYESTSQFNREFKRLFGLTPAAEVRRMKASFALPPAQPGSDYVSSH